MNNINKIAHFIALILLAGALNSSYSQDLDFDEIRVVAPYMPTISEAFKILENPEVTDDTTRVEIDFNYTIVPIKITTSFELEPINAARMRGEPLNKLYKGHFKAGVGTHATPYSEIFYNTLRSNEYAYGVRAKHLSSNGDIENHEFSQYSNNSIDLFGKHFYRNINLNADLGYNRDMVHYYGFLRDDFEDNPLTLYYIDNLRLDQIQQSFNIFNANLSYNTTHLDSTKLHHSAGINYRTLIDLYDLAEHKFSLFGHIGSQLPPDPLGFSETQYFDLFARGDFYNYSVLDETTTRGLISLEPRLSSQYKDFRFYIGLNVITQIDKNTYLKFYPQAHAEADIVKDVLIAYGTFSGGMDKYDFYGLTRTNPYMNTNMDAQLKFMNRKSDLRGGFKGSISSFVAYNFSVSNAEIDNFGFFVNDTTTLLNNKFTMVYDNIRRFNFRAEIFTQISERFRLRLTADYYEYSMFDEIEPWHMPTVLVNANGRYNIQDKIIISLDAYARNSTFAREFNEAGNITPIEIEGFHVDTNISVEYRYTRRLSVFLNFNNVQNQSLERWYNYPTQRFNFIGGITYSF